MDGVPKVNNTPEIGNTPEKQPVLSEAERIEQIREIGKKIGQKTLETVKAEDFIKEKMGDNNNVIIADINQRDRTNVLNEAIDLKLKNDARIVDVKIIGGASKLLPKLPVIGTTAKAVYAGIYKSRADKKINQTGNLESAFEVLGLDPKSSRVLNADKDSTERVRQAIARGDEQVSYLNQNEKVERIEDAETESNIKSVLNEYYQEYKSLHETADADELKNLREKYAEKAQGLFKGQNLSINLNSQMDSIENIVKERDIESKVFEEYLENNTSFYRAELQRGINTKKEADAIVNKVVETGIVAGVFFAVGTREGRKFMRKAIGVMGAKGGLAGAAVGGIYGYYRGINKGKAKFSSIEVNNSTFAGEASSKAPSRAQKAVASVVHKFGNNKIAQKIKNSETGKTIHDWKTGKEFLDEIDKLRDRKDASYFIDKITSLEQDSDPDTDDELKTTLADIIARGLVSNEKHIDLIKYKDDERNQLEQLIEEAGKRVYKEQDPAKLREYLFGNSNEALTAFKNKFIENADKAKELEDKYTKRIALVSAVSGALIGGSAGTLAYLALETETGQNIISGIKEEISNAKISGLAGATEVYAESGEVSTEDNLDTIEPIINSDGSISYEIGGHTFNDLEFKDGVLTDDSIKEIQDAVPGALINKVPDYETVPADIQTTSITAREFFDLDPNDAEPNSELVNINPDRIWMSANNGGDKVGFDVETWPQRDDDGSIVMQFKTNDGENINFEDTKLFFTAGNDAANTGITLNVEADGTVRVPSDSPLVQMFDDNGYYKGQAELIHETDNATEVYYTMGNNNLNLDSHITVPNTGEARTTFVNQISGYVDADGNAVPAQIIVPPEDSAMVGEINAHRGAGVIKGLEDVKRIANETLANTTSETATLNSATVDGVPVTNLGTLDIRDHIGGYRASENPFHDPSRAIFDGEKYSGASVPRKILGDAAKGLSNEEINNTVLAKLQDPNSDLTVDQFTEAYLEDVSKSPESIVRMRALLEDGKGLLYPGSDDNYVDSMEEINEYANMLANGPAEEYDRFVNETFKLLSDKLDGGSIRIINYSNESYQYTTYSELIGSDIRQFAQIKDGPCDGIGIEFLDKNGNSIYNYKTAHDILGIPYDQEITHIAERTNCQQETVEVDQPGHPSRPGSTGHEGTGSTGNEDTDSTGSEDTGSTGDEGTDSTGDEGTGKTDHNVTSGDDTDLPVTPDEDDFVEGGGDNSVDPGTAPGSQVVSQPTDDSAFSQGDAGTSTGSDTTSSYSTDTSKWQGDSSGGGGGDKTPSDANPGSAEKNVEDRSDEDLSNILKGEDKE